MEGSEKVSSLFQSDIAIFAPIFFVECRFDYYLLLPVVVLIAVLDVRPPCLKIENSRELISLWGRNLLLKQEQRGLTIFPPVRPTSIFAPSSSCA